MQADRQARAVAKSTDWAVSLPGSEARVAACPLGERRELLNLSTSVLLCMKWGWLRHFLQRLRELAFAHMLRALFVKEVMSIHLPDHPRR